MDTKYKRASVIRARVYVRFGNARGQKRTEAEREGKVEYARLRSSRDARSPSHFVPSAHSAADSAGITQPAHTTRSMHRAEESSIFVESSDSGSAGFVKEIPNSEAVSRARTRAVTTLDAGAHNSSSIQMRNDVT